MPFNQNPILNSPYEAPAKHWQLDDEGVPTQHISDGRRPSRFLTPIPKATAKKRQKAGELNLQADPEQQKDNSSVNTIREELANWRKKPLHQRGISGVTERLLRHWTEDKVTPRPFFCQIEAVETFIWLNEVAPQMKTQKIRELLDEIKDANNEGNMGLPRLAAKMATGAGKTTVMAMLIAYHAINKSRSPQSSKYSNRFLIITPGITIKDRLRVLLPQDPNNYYEKSNIVPDEMMADIKKAAVVITNYHAFKHREKIEFSKIQQKIMKGNSDEIADTKETDGQMLQRVCRELIGSNKEVIVINDEAHHCYIHRKKSDENAIEEGEREEVNRNKEAARLWINGINALRGKTGIKAVYDLSATPFFLRGSGYPEGSLFRWVVSDFSLMDAIESGIVKLPRVPTQDATEQELPIYRNIYQHISKDLPKRGAANQTEKLDPQKLPSQLMGALQALYTNYEKTYNAWQEQGIDIPPAFIIVCNNTSTSKLVYDLVSGYEVTEGRWRQGMFPLFNNAKEDGSGLLARPRTLLIDSYQLESGDALSDDFRKTAAAEIELFKKEQRIRDPSRDIGTITDAELLREVMNTVGKKGKLGERIRCVVSVSMLTEGWDTNNVTHILGVRAFGTQLLCEQVVGRALRRYSYELEEEGDSVGKFSPEYADVLGVPFKFASGEDTSKPKPPKPQTRVRHLDERAKLEITFPRVRGYRIKPPETRITANFDANSRLTITPEMAPPVTAQEGIVGEGIILTLDELKNRRLNEVIYFLAAYITNHYYKTDEGGISPARFRDLVPIVRHYLEKHVKCQDGTLKQYLLWHSIAVKAAEKIYRACVPGKKEGSEHLLPLIDPFTPEGSTDYVDFPTRKKRLHETHPDKSHINIAVCDSDWEMELCKTLEATPEVFSYARNEGLRFEVPYTHEEKQYVYLPDFIILMDDGHGEDDLLRLVVEVKGYRNGYAQTKADTMNRLWIPAVNNHGGWGRWAFEEIMDPQYFNMELMENQTPPGKVLEKYTRRNGKGY